MGGARFCGARVKHQLPAPRGPRRPRRRSCGGLFMSFSQRRVFVTRCSHCFRGFTSGAVTGAPGLSALRVMAFYLCHLGMHPSSVTLVFDMDGDTVSAQRGQVGGGVREGVWDAGLPSASGRTESCCVNIQWGRNFISPGRS